MTGLKLIVILLLIVFSFAAGAYFLMNWQKVGTPITSGPADGKRDVSASASKPAPSSPQASQKADQNQPGRSDAASGTETSKTQTAKVEPTETQKESGAQKPMAPELKIETAKQDTKNRVEPTIDVARVDPDGNAVFAGRSKPGWKIRIEADGNILGETTADQYGEWVVVPDKPVAPGKQSLTLRAVSPSGTVGVSSPEKITVIVNREPKEKVVAEVRSPAAKQKLPSQAYSSYEHGASVDAQKSSPAESKSTEETGKASLSQTTEKAETVEARQETAASQISEKAETSTASPSAASPSGTDRPASGTSKTAMIESAKEAMPAPESAETRKARPSSDTRQEEKSDEASSSTEGSSGAANSEKTIFGRVREFFTGDEAEEKAKKEEERTVALVSFDSVDFLTGLGKTGRFVLSGTGLPGMRVRAYLEDKFLGEAQVGSDGRWAISERIQLPSGIYMVIAEQLDPEGTILSRAELPFDRQVPEGVRVAEAGAKEETLQTSNRSEGTSKSEATAMANMTGPANSNSAEEEGSRSEEPRLAAVDSERVEKSASESAPKAQIYKSKKRRLRAKRNRRRYRSRRYVVVRRGDSLWEIAERYYGRGYRYRKIYRLNKRKIDDPNLIYPRQRFKLR